MPKKESDLAEDMGHSIEEPSGYELIGKDNRVAPWRFSTSGIASRLFITCWLVYGLHFATNIVREIYPALSLGDHLSFRVDEYAYLHPDLFEKEGYGWHIGNNPGASMLAAIPYAAMRPIIDPIVQRVQNTRLANNETDPPPYQSPWPMAREFYREAWQRGLDIKFGLAAFVMQSMCMAPVSALGVVCMFFLLRRLFNSDQMGLWLSLLYAFGTPVFFRTGFLNHNMMLGHFAFMGFVTMWNPGASFRWSTHTRFFLGGLAGGTALLFDYSGAILLLGLFAYGIAKRIHSHSIRDSFQHACWYVLGTLGPVALLLFYQWKSFGHPFYPGQHWMPPVQWSDLGYQGYGWPQLKLFSDLAFDHRFGLFPSSPLILLGVFCPLLSRRARRCLPEMELALMLVVFVAFWVFFSGSNYTGLQFNTGIRYMAPILPFLFVPAAVVLVRLPRQLIYLIAVISVWQSWCFAMYREVGRELGVLEPIVSVFLNGFQLPVLTTLSRIGEPDFAYLGSQVSPLPLLVLTGILLYGLWAPSYRIST